MIGRFTGALTFWRGNARAARDGCREAQTGSWGRLRAFVSTLARADSDSMADSNLLVWIDMEMTGLDPSQHRILEIATLITNAELEIVGEGRTVDPSIRRSARGNERMEPDPAPAGSGLVDRVRRSATSVTEAETSTLEFIARHCPAGATSSPNSVHLDRRFLQHHMPKLEAHLHYRNVDVSTLQRARTALVSKRLRRCAEESRSSSSARRPPPIGSDCPRYSPSHLRPP